MKQNRVFFHSLTNEPYLIDEAALQTTNDSEDELDTSWIVEIEEKVTSPQEIDSFTDVSIVDKEFFKLWNHFIHTHYPIASDCMMLEACTGFLKSLEEQRTICKFSQSFVMHLITLWQSNIITGDDMMLIRLVTTIQKLENALQVSLNYDKVLQSYVLIGRFHYLSCNIWECK